MPIKIHHNEKNKNLTDSKIDGSLFNLIKTFAIYYLINLFMIREFSYNKT